MASLQQHVCIEAGNGHVAQIIAMGKSVALTSRGYSENHVTSKGYLEYHVET